MKDLEIDRGLVGYHKNFNDIFDKENITSVFELQPHPVFKYLSTVPFLNKTPELERQYECYTENYQFCHMLNGVFCLSNFSLLMTNKYNIKTYENYVHV